jgi:hypothetical protein
MSKFLQNWTYDKHAILVTSAYIGIATLGNALLGKRIPEDEKSLSPIQICKSMTKKQRVFNGIVCGCFAFDMSITYLVINHFKKQFK